MQSSETRRRVAEARSGHLATTRPDGAPHLVVVTFAVVGDRIVTAIDQKPKSTTRLQRLVNVETNPKASFLVDHYDEDWDELWWVRVDGKVAIHTSGEAFDDAIEALVARYPQYVGHRPEGPVLAISMDRITGWKSTP